MARKNEATPGAMTLGVVKIAPHVSASNKLGINQSGGSNLLGKNADTVAQLPCLRQGVEIAPSATTLGVVNIALYVSPSNKLGINQSNGSILLGKMRSSSQTTIKGHSEKSIKYGRGHSLRQTCDKKSIKRGRGRSLRQTHDKKSMYHERGRSFRKTHDKKSMDHERGRSLRKTHDKKSFYIKHAHGRSLRVFTEKFTIRILWHVASKLIRKKKTT
jgi:hypothetical protein